MKTPHTHDNRITGLESKLATRDCGWAFAFPMTLQHQWLSDDDFVAEPGDNRRWAVLRRPITGLWRRIAERGGRPCLNLAIQAQEIIDLFRALSHLSSRLDGAAASGPRRGSSCN